MISTQHCFQEISVRISFWHCLPSSLYILGHNQSKIVHFITFLILSLLLMNSPTPSFGRLDDLALFKFLDRCNQPSLGRHQALEPLPFRTDVEVGACIWVGRVRSDLLPSSWESAVDVADGGSSANGHLLAWECCKQPWNDWGLSNCRPIFILRFCTEKKLLTRWLNVWTVNLAATLTPPKSNLKLQLRWPPACLHTGSFQSFCV